MIAYRATLDVPRELAQFAGGYCWLTAACAAQGVEDPRVSGPRMSRSALQLHLRHGAMSSAWPPRLSGDELIERDPEQDSVDARDRTDRRVERGIQ